MKDGNVLKKIVVHGNQLMEQACNTQWTQKLGETEAERLEGLECTFSEFHRNMCMYEIQWLKVVYSTTVRMRYLLTGTVQPSKIVKLVE